MGVRGFFALISIHLLQKVLVQFASSFCGLDLWTWQGVWRFTDFIAVARDAVIVFRALVKILSAAFAIRAVTISSAVEAVTTVAGGLIQLLIEVASLRITIAVAGWKISG